MRFCWLLVLPPVLLGCGPSPEELEKIEEVKAYLLRVVDAEKRYHVANQTYSLNMKELMNFDPSLGEPPAGYTVEGGGGLALAFRFEVRATPEGSGPHFYADDSGVIRYSNWGPADQDSDPVE